MQHWEMTDEIAGVDIAGLENEGPDEGLGFAVLENDKHVYATSQSHATKKQRNCIAVRMLTNMKDI